MEFTKEQLQGLLEYLNRTVFERDGEGTVRLKCDNALRKTEQFLRPLGVWSDDVREWLGDYGGFCDCEVALNVGGYWEDKL